MFPVIPTTQLIERLNALTLAFFPIGVGLKSFIKLYKNDVSPDANMTPATFTEADFEGYDNIEAVMTTASLNDQGLVVSKSNLCNWMTEAGVEVQTVYGVYITNVDGDKIIAAQRFEAPQVVGGPLPQAITGVWRASEPSTNYGWIDVES